MKIIIDPADAIFSKYVRLRDKRCVRCGSPGRPDKNGLPIIGLQCSHYFGRGKELTRFLPENADSLCMGCHRYWETTDREDYRNFKLKQLGKKKFDALVATANLYCKKDRKLAYIFAKKLFDKLLNEQDF